LGPAETVAVELARAEIDPGATVVVGHGEPTVTVTGPGRGGRAQHVALAAAVELAGSARTVGVVGTDGIDGPTPNAGAV
ncbi:MAG: hypothetical protein GWN79_25600, partial [Actinobacteria bacterium]|nr:hypothetical protein [Actinomycetota bacterium]NIS29059.1 hypothetical protein [Actinomycetota bacterium]NIT98592.1 hypothetical protein [Actinomycetota bacterium]NIU22221.1 hypothetical protein [Actinomycetota bacterium]NIU64465.1 hypothetical protein [Actinomycetota bacterium]